MLLGCKHPDSSGKTPGVFAMAGVVAIQLFSHSFAFAEGLTTPSPHRMLYSMHGYLPVASAKREQRDHHHRSWSNQAINTTLQQNDDSRARLSTAIKSSQPYGTKPAQPAQHIALPAAADIAEGNIRVVDLLAQSNCTSDIIQSEQLARNHAEPYIWQSTRKGRIPGHLPYASSRTTAKQRNSLPIKMRLVPPLPTVEAQNKQNPFQKNSDFTVEKPLMTLPR
jgi:hypothetical protein